MFRYGGECDPRALVPCSPPIASTTLLYSSPSITFTALALVLPDLRPPHASFPQPIQTLLPALHSLHFWLCSTAIALSNIICHLTI
eukprot:g4530.t1